MIIFVACNKGQHGLVHCVRFSPGGESYGSGFEDGTLRIWQTVMGPLSSKDNTSPVANGPTKQASALRVTSKTEDLHIGSKEGPKIKDQASYFCRSRFAPGGCTEKKAKQLLIKTVEMVNFHDIMYHSAIAFQLASDLLKPKPSVNTYAELFRLSSLARMIRTLDTPRSLGGNHLAIVLNHDLVADAY
ncbi:serine-threonine kinase receptor-associated protein-like protein, partial [Tanacetum coccineum]